MSKVCISGTNIISSLGFTTHQNLLQIEQGNIGIKQVDDKRITPEPLPVSLVPEEPLLQRAGELSTYGPLTRFEKFLLLSVIDALTQTSLDASSEDTLFIISTTKGNVELLSADHPVSFERERVYLWKSAQIVQQYFGNPNTPLVISNACISGVAGLVNGMRLIQSGRYKNVVVVGADVISRFIVSGFQSFKSLDDVPCRPFDANRQGLTIGEGAGTIILTSQEDLKTYDALLVKGSISNDANHISGPSRTGEGLYVAIKNTLPPEASIDFISAHGTGTPYNDDMESKALKRTGLDRVPVNSYKGYFGHTLGAAGLIETVLSLESMKQNVLHKTANYKESGTAEKINIVASQQYKQINQILKIASGFGGCNAAL